MPSPALRIGFDALCIEAHTEIFKAFRVPDCPEEASPLADLGPENPSASGWPPTSIRALSTNTHPTTGGLHSGC